MTPETLSHELDALHEAYVERVNHAIGNGEEILVDQLAADYDAELVALVGDDRSGAPTARPARRSRTSGRSVDASRWRRLTHRAGRHAA